LKKIYWPDSLIAAIMNLTKLSSKKERLLWQNHAKLVLILQKIHIQLWVCVGLIRQTYLCTRGWGMVVQQNQLKEPVGLRYTQMMIGVVSLSQANTGQSNCIALIRFRVFVESFSKGRAGDKKLLVAWS
jgi:hypothetical protein